MPFLIDTPAHPESNKLYSTQGPFPPTKGNIMKNGLKKKKKEREEKLITEWGYLISH